jgi:hypothetical protein
MAVTPWLATYPFSDPLFQNFNVQQYYTVTGVVGPSQMYETKAPEVEEKPAEAEDKKAGK